MGRILAIDYGRRRCGVAVTDPLQITAGGLPTVRACDILQFVKDYCNRERVEQILVGYPRTLRGEDSESMRYIRPFVAKLQQEMPTMKVTLYDERFTSAIAHQAMIDGGMRKSQRQVKGNVDEIAATILLTDYLNSRR